MATNRHAVRHWATTACVLLLYTCSVLPTSCAARAINYASCVQQFCSDVPANGDNTVCGEDPAARYPSYCHAMCDKASVYFRCPVATKCSAIPNCHECAGQTDSAQKVCCVQHN